MADRIVIDKLNDDNYMVWAMKMRMLLIKEGYWHFIQAGLENVGGGGGAGSNVVVSGGGGAGSNVVVSGGGGAGGNVAVGRGGNAGGNENVSGGGGARSNVAVGKGDVAGRNVFGGGGVRLGNEQLVAEIQQKALALICLKVTDGQLTILRSARLGTEAWSILRDHHRRNTIGNRFRALKTLFRTNLESGGSMQEHLRKMS